MIVEESPFQYVTGQINIFFDAKTFVRLYLLFAIHVVFWIEPRCTKLLAIGRNETPLFVRRERYGGGGGCSCTSDIRAHFGVPVTDIIRRVVGEITGHQLGMTADPMI